MNQSHRNAVSQQETPNTPYSLTYISANNNVWSRPNSQFALERQPTAAPSLPVKSGSRVQYRAKAKKAFKYAKKSLRMAVAYVKPISSGSATAPTSFAVLRRANSRLSMHARLSVIEIAPRNTSTPSVCVTQPTIRGTNVRVSYQNTNVRYSVHQVPPTPEVTQTFLLDESDSPVSDKRKSMRFSHPAVNGVMSALRPNSSGQSTIGEETASLFPGTPTTVATTEFEDQVNPKRVFRNSQMVSDGETFDSFKDVMDGVKAKPAPRLATTVQVQAAPPSLPYIALAPAMQLGDSLGDSLGDGQAPSPTKPTTTTRTSIIVSFSTTSHPNTLTIGSNPVGGVPLSKPRTTAPRPHTTGELANFLPYIPYNPRFNPYDHTLTPTSAHLTSQESSDPSADELAAAFAEAEAAEQQLRHKRHTTLYADVEAGILPPLSSSTPPPPPPTHQIKRKAVPAPAPAADTASVPSETAAAHTSKPLPPLPSPSSPRRFTQAFVPPVVPMGDGRYPDLERPAGAEKKMPRREREKVSGGEKKPTTVKGKDVKRSRSQKVRAVENALRRLF